MDSFVQKFCMCSNTTDSCALGTWNIFAPTTYNASRLFCCRDPSASVKATTIVRVFEVRVGPVCVGFFFHYLTCKRVCWKRDKGEGWAVHGFKKWRRMKLGMQWLLKATCSIEACLACIASTCLLASPIVMGEGIAVLLKCTRSTVVLQCCACI